MLHATTCPSVAAVDPAWVARGVNGVVACDSEQASQAGLEMLKAGGNAIDATVAASFALAVTRADSTGLGGGGFMIARFADGRIIVDDFRETAPAAASVDMYVHASLTEPARPMPSRIGHLAVAVPGLVAGRCQALVEFGTMPLAKVLAPAIRLAQNGFPVDKHYIDTTAEVLATFQQYPSLRESCGYVYRTHLRNGSLRSIGDALVQPELATLLEELARNGPDFFYRGPVAKSIERHMRKHGGIITINDLADYSVRRRQPLRWSYREFRLIGMPPPSSGGVALAEAMNILETLDLQTVARRDPGLAAHYQVEAMKHAFADRARWLGDADFCTVPTKHLLSDGYAGTCAAMLDPNRCAALEAYGCVQIPDDAGTSHLCVADRFGNVVVSTETVNTAFGSLAAVDEWGLILNNEMDDFVAEPGKPNAFGLVQAACNGIAPGKRPLSSMSPTIVLKDDKPYLLLGGSGGPRIISSVLDVFVYATDFGMSLEKAMVHTRVHHQWQPNEIIFDMDPPAPIEEGLRQRGHKLSATRKTGIVQAVQQTDAGWIAASDPRKGGKPAGY